MYSLKRIRKIYRIASLVCIILCIFLHFTERVIEFKNYEITKGIIIDRVRVEQSYFSYRSGNNKGYKTLIDYRYQVKDSIFENRAEETFYPYSVNEKTTIYYLKTDVQKSTTKDSFWTFNFTIRFLYLFIALISLFTVYMSFIAFNEYKIKDDLE